MSTRGGEFPRWNPQGHELFYVEGDAIMAVDVETESLSLGEPRLLFRKPGATDYDVAPDGERFVMILAGEESDAEPRSIVLVQNWTRELARRSPSDH